METLEAPNPKSRPLWIYLTLFTTLLGALAGYRFAYRWEDAYWYYQIADGKTSGVIHPFVVRQLAPIAIHLLHTTLNLELNRSFALFGLACMFAFSGIYFWFLSAKGVAWHWMLTSALLSFWALSFSNYMLPDLLNNLLLLLFILSLAKQEHLWSIAILLLLALSRESVLLVLGCFLIAAIRRVRWTILLGGVASTWIGMQAVKRLTSAGLQNRQGLGDLAYTVLKIPFNFAVNVLGVDPWLNTLRTHCSVPLKAIQLPFHLGGIREVGYCGYQPLYQLSAAGSWLCEFGVLLVFLVLLLKRYRWKILDQPLYLRFCMLYGASCFLLAPLLGSAVDRLVSYSWPLFLVAVPILASRLWSDGPTSDKLAIAALSGALSWLFYFCEAVHPSQLGLSVLVLVAVVAGWYLSVKLHAPALPGEVGLEP